MRPGLGRQPRATARQSLAVCNLDQASAGFNVMILIAKMMTMTTTITMTTTKTMMMMMMVVMVMVVVVVTVYDDGDCMVVVVVVRRGRRMPTEPHCASHGAHHWRTGPEAICAQVLGRYKEVPCCAIYQDIQP